MNVKKTCSVDGCEKRAFSRGWCSCHYSRWKRNGHHLRTLYNLDHSKTFKNNIKKNGDGCWDWQGANNGKGYGCLRVDGKRVLAHRYSYEAHIGPIPRLKNSYHGVCVLHKCDNPSCVNPDHLFLGTHNDNMQDKMSKGRSGVVKLSASTVAKMKQEYLSGKTCHRELAKKFGTSYQNVGAILSGKTWKHVSVENHTS